MTPLRFFFTTERRSVNVVPKYLDYFQVRQWIQLVPFGGPKLGNGYLLDEILL